MMNIVNSDMYKQNISIFKLDKTLSSIQNEDPS